jgi:hypothetical protein
MSAWHNPIFSQKSVADEVEDGDAQALPKVKQARSRKGGSKEEGGPFIRLKDIYAL